MEWTEDYIESIVISMSENSIVPIIGPNVFRYYGEEKDGVFVQDYVARTLLRNHLQDEANEQNFLLCSNGIKGMTRLEKLFNKHNKKLNGYLYKLYRDLDFLSNVKLDDEVLRFLQLGNFPLILTTINYNFLEAILTFHGRKYDSVSYKKEKVKNNREQDIILKEDKHEIAHPAIFHLFGTISTLPGACVVTEDDFLKFLHCLQDTNTRPENLKEYLKLENRKYLLTLGCDIPDWTFRFLLYSLKANEYGMRDNNAAANYFVGGAIDSQLSDDVVEFLMDIGYFPGKEMGAFLQDINKHLSPAVKPKVFLSLCSEEYDSIGDPLCRALSKLFDVWLYKYDGDQYQYWNDIERGIEVGLKASEFILPVITPKTIDKIDDYMTPSMSNDDMPGLIEEWIRAKRLHIKCCPLYIDRDETRLKKALKRSKCCELLWPFFFGSSGNAGLSVDLKTFTAEKLYNHLENHLNKQ